MRLTTTLGWLAKKESIRVNCIVPDWVASEEVRIYWESLTPELRKAQDVPDTLITLDEIADIVVRLIVDEGLAGRVMIWYNGQEPKLIPAGDRGYERLE